MTDEKSSIPPWAGRLPFEPDKKKPHKFRVEDCLTRLYGKNNHKVLTGTYLSTDKLSCSSFRILPGCYFEPYDIHGGDEIYYLAAGSGTVLNPLTGRTYRFEAGEFMWIPQGVWHQFYNFGNEEACIVTAFAPKMWSDMGTHVIFDEDPVIYNSKNIDWRKIPKETGYKDDGKAKTLGCFPANGPAARKSQDIFVTKPSQALNLVHGKENRMLVSFFVSNDFVHAGTMTLPAGFESDDETHKGDELIYVAQGSVSVIIKTKDFDPASVSVERYEVHQGQRFFIPENTKHSYVSFNRKNSRLVFFIAPEL